MRIPDTSSPPAATSPAAATTGGSRSAPAGEETGRLRMSRWSVETSSGRHDIKVNRLGYQYLHFQCKSPLEQGSDVTVRAELGGQLFQIQARVTRVYSQACQVEFLQSADALMATAIEELGGRSGLIDQRRSRRHGRAFQVHLPGLNVRAAAANVSLAGIRLNGMPNVGVHSIVDMVLQLEQNPVPCRGRIAWCHASDTGHAVGVEFIDLSPTARRLIQSHISGTPTARKLRQ